MWAMFMLGRSLSKWSAKDPAQREKLTRAQMERFEQCISDKMEGQRCTGPRSLSARRWRSEGDREAAGG